MGQLKHALIFNASMFFKNACSVSPMDRGDRIAKAIKDSGVDVAAVATACNVSEQAVYSWMRGIVKNLRNDNLFALSDVTGFNARWIGTGQGPEIETYSRNPHIARVVKAMQAMPEVVQEEAAKEVDDLASFAARISKPNGTDG